jgi:hypothetical protein
MSKINIKGIEITVIRENEDDYISLTEMVSLQEDGPKLIEKWLNNKSTVDFLGAWEQMFNPNFKTPEFRGFRENAGSGGFFVSAKKWIEFTGAIGITAKKGRYGGTYAHKDIAFEFGTYISPEFKLLLIKEFQRLKQEEFNRIESGWDLRRLLTKTNYSIHTDAIKNYIIPDITDAQIKYVYANEADVLNIALFGMTAKQWKESNPKSALENLNMRDFADVHQLIILSNLESNNAFLISSGMPQKQRILNLRKLALSQLKSLRDSIYTIEKIQSPFIKNKELDNL